jgi:hypothetical protein
LNGNGFFGWVEWERLFRLGWMGTAFSAGLNGNGFFIWIAAGWSTQRGGQRSGVVNAGGWSTQVGGQRRVVNAGGWSTQGGQRRWVVNAGGWSTQRGGQRSGMVGAAGWSAQRGGRRSWVMIDLFLRCKLACSRCLPEWEQAEWVFIWSG